MSASIKSALDPGGEAILIETEGSRCIDSVRRWENDDHHELVTSSQVVYVSAPASKPNLTSTTRLPLYRRPELPLPPDTATLF